MKKLLSLLSVLTISGAGVPTTIAASPYQKQETNLVNNFNLKKINGIDDANCIVKDKKNNLYIGTNNSIYILKNETNEIIKINEIEGKINSLAIDSKSNLYIGTNDGAYILKNETNETEFIKSEDTENGLLTEIKSKVNNILINKMDNDAIFIASNAGFYATLKPNNKKQVLVFSDRIKVSGYFLNVDKNNNVYVSSLNEIYYLNIPEARFEKINWTNEHINSIINDENNLYIGTNDGIYTLKQDEKKVTKINGINEKINSIIMDKNNNVYFSANNIIYLLLLSTDNVNNALIKKMGYINSDIIVNNIVIIDNNLYIAASDGVYSLYLKNNLENIDNLNLKDLIVNKNKKYKDLTNTILESEIFKEFKLVDPNIKFIDMNGNDISDKQQNSGQFQIKILANKNDFYWKGETKLITLSFIDEITFLIQKNQQIKEEANKIKLDLDLLYKQIEQKKNLYNEMQGKIFKNYEKIIELQNKQIINLTNKDSLLLEIKQKLESI